MFCNTFNHITIFYKIIRFWLLFFFFFFDFFFSSVMSVLPGANDNEKLNALCEKTYKEQAVWFLNAFWGILFLFSC